MNEKLQDFIPQKIYTYLNFCVQSREKEKFVKCGQMAAEKTGNYKYIGIIIVLLLVIGYFVTQKPAQVTGDASKAEESVKALYEIVSGSPAEVIKTVDENGLYKVTLRVKDATGRDTLADVFVTKNGLFLTDRLVEIEGQKSSLKNQSAFVQCLFDKNVRILGLANDTATQVQLQELGAFSPRIYVDCSGQSLPLCLQLNITSIPAIFNGAVPVIAGPLNRAWFEQNTGCYMTANGTIA